MWNRHNMMHESNRMSQHNSSYFTKRPYAVTMGDHLYVARWIGVWMLLLWLPLANAQPTMPIKGGLDGYRLVDRWVRAWKVPAQDDPQSVTLPVSVAIVTLRLDGRVFGRGSASSLDPSPSLVYLATKRAIRGASTKLTGERDALWDDFIKDLSGRLTITLEISDTLVPMSDSELDLPGFGYTPGVLGVGVRRGDHLEVTGPESMLMHHTDMTQSALALANSLAGDGSAVLSTPRELRDAGYTFYRFEPMVLAQPGVSMGASILDRGGRVIEGSEISTRSIEVLSQEIAKHLLSRRWAGVERYGLTGTLDPVTGKSVSAFASPFEQAIASYALLRFGHDGENALERDAMRGALNILRDLSLVEDGETPVGEDPLGASMAIIALSEIQLVDILADEQLNALRTQSLAVLDGLYSESGGFDGSIHEPSRGLVALALVRAAVLDPTDRTALARSAIERVFLETPASAMVTQMPFLGWAQLEADHNAISVEHLETLSQMRSLVWAHQLHRADLAWMDRDLEGGIVFTSAKTPLPSWLSMRPLAFIATMLGDARLTPGSIASGDVPSEIGKLVDSIRFVRQLCADDETLHFYSSGTSPKWGVRMALWDQRMPVEGDAMALLTLTETRHAFDAIVGRAKP